MAKKKKQNSQGKSWLVFFLIVIVIILGFAFFKEGKKTDNQSPEVVLENANQPQVANEELEKPSLPENVNQSEMNTNTNQPKEKEPVSSLKTYLEIIIDDFGYQPSTQSPTKDFLALDIPLTLAIIPGTDYAQEVAAVAFQKGFEVIIHQPMEPIDSTIELSKNAILDSMSEEEANLIIYAAVQEIPQAVGLNNHQGSKATQNEKLMTGMMEELKNNDLYFVDSFTHPDSVAYQEAQKAGLKTAKREVFLDNEEEVAYIKGQIRELVDLALKSSSQPHIGIGHAKEKTYQALVEMLGELEKEGVGLKKVSEVL